ENAGYFQNAGAALVFMGEDAKAQTLADAVKMIATDDEKRKAMAAASLKIGERDGSSLIAEVLKEKINRCFLEG
ncbi:MAG: hypothetical protein LBI12_08345, partial [Treponema sp.]|nr:hypothetical protein [Treponema sp.]